MGLHSDAATEARLIELLHDDQPLVERMACEALVRAGQQATWKQLAPLLGSPDRYVVWAATRALERVPKESWREQALAAKNPRLFLQGALALLVVDPDRQTAEAILSRVEKLLTGYLSDPDFLDLLRVTELALDRGKIQGDQIPTLRKKLANEYPSRDRILNRELIRLIAYLQEPAANARIIAELQSDMPLEEKLHLALYAAVHTELDHGPKAQAAGILRDGPQRRGRPQLHRVYRECLAGSIRRIDGRRAGAGVGRRREVAQLGPLRARQAARQPGPRDARAIANARPATHRHERRAGPQARHRDRGCAGP